jgi:hypothetical protein
MANDPKLQPATHPDKFKTRDDFVKAFCPGKVCAEIGVAQGSFSAVILSAKPAQLHLIDPWIYQSTEFYPGDQANRPDNENLAAHQNVIRSFAHLPGVIIRRDFSFDAAQKYPDGFFDFAFIDAIHTLPMCLADCVAWWPKIRKGGWLTGHDFNLGEMPGCPALSVNAALQQFLFLIHREKLDLVTYEQDSWGIQK